MAGRSLPVLACVAKASVVLSCGAVAASCSALSVSHGTNLTPLVRSDGDLGVRRVYGSSALNGGARRFGTVSRLSAELH
jgi:hypothetical protein